MALPALCRRVPVLRDLSVMAATRDKAPASTYKILNMQWSSSTSTDSSEKSVASTSATTGAPSDVTSQATAGAPTAEAGSPAVASTTPSSSQPTRVGDEEEWTEVVHSSGQLYYWNQRTGETTQLGEPKPQSEKGSGGGGRGSDGDGAGSDGAGASGRKAGASGGGATYDPRAEAPLEDRTGTYAAVGILAGAFLGWVSQFL